MKTTIQLAISGFALFALLCGAAAQATNVSKQPLKLLAQGKPNVIFGMDSSGSMDTEMLIQNTSDGSLWWNFDTRSGWNASGTLWFNIAGSGDLPWRKMIYLFPNGTADGARRYSDTAANPHFAVPPTPEFAFLRSPNYNPIYYDPSEVYLPWGPGWVGGALRTFGNASITAAKSHPVQGTGTFNLTQNFVSTAANWTFRAFPGMKLPGTASVLDGSWKTVSTLGWAQSGGMYVVPASQSLPLSMAYFPATYYLKEVCTANGSDCVNAPDGSTLKRYEIKPASYATTAEYNQAIQNFANWWQYYRKRELTLSAAMGQALEPITGLRMGAIRFSSHPAATTRVPMYDTEASSAEFNARRVVGFIYETNSGGGTPARSTLNRIGYEYMQAGGPVQYACQRNNAFLITDGFATIEYPNSPAYNQATWGTGAPYATTYADSLADIALAYYTVNLQPSLPAGRVSRTALDTNTNLHMNTYALAMGARGLLYTSESTPRPTDPAAWTNPVQNRHPSSIDDLWHATINGRGQMYLADTPQETAAKIQSGLQDILNMLGAQGTIGVNTVNLSRGDSRAYVGTYNPSGWTGDLTANPIDLATATVGTTPIWSAGTKLLARDWNTRVIAAAAPGGARAFTAGNVGAIVNPGGIYGTNVDVVNYLRGDRTHEGKKFRIRRSLMGAVINSDPLVARDEGVVYVQSGEGMLHAFETKGATAGDELWAFVPASALSQIGQTVVRSYAFSTKLDGSPVVAKLSSGSKLLVAGAGVAGRSYYALDVTNPRGLTDAGVAGLHRWTFPSDTPTGAKMGDALGRPVIVKSDTDGDVVLLTSGYNNTADGRGRLWMLNATTGAVIHEFTVGAGTLGAESGLAQVSAFMESSGSVRYVYGGDLLGNVWRFDLKEKTAPSLIATLKGPSGAVQPVTAAPELVMVQGQRIVLVGSGRLLDISDFGSNLVQTFYAIADGATLANARTALVQRTYNAGTDSLSGATIDWTTGRGWYLDLPAGNQANTRATLAYGAVAFVTNTTGANDCSASSRLWVLDLLSGGAFAGTDFVSTLISSTANSTGVTALLTTTGQIIGSGQDADGKPWQRDIAKSSTLAPAKSSWREIRSR